MRITLLWIDHCWNCGKRVFVLKTWYFRGLKISGVNTTYFHHVGEDCVMIKWENEKK